MNITNYLKKYKIIRKAVSLWRQLSCFIHFQPLNLFKQYSWFFKQFGLFCKSQNNNKFKKIEWYPCLLDNLSYTPVEPVYFFQDTWAAKHLFQLKPKHHYDVGSSVKTMGILSQCFPVTMVDIRPTELKLDNLFFLKASIINLPFKDNSIRSLSSLCVVEHIGLGRYGDQIDPLGSEKAVKELKRILSPGGIFLFSVPVSSDNIVYFNAHRAFTREYILELFDDFSIVDEKYIYDTKLFEQYSPEKGFGTGMFLLKKR